MILSSEFAYLALTVPFLLAWMLFYAFARAETRRHQLLRSIAGIFLGILSETLYFHDYWCPQSICSVTVFSVRVLLEDALFGFAVVGIGSTCYETLLQKRRVRFKKVSFVEKVAVLVLIVFLVYGFSLVLNRFAGINSIFSTALVMFFASCGILINRLDLLRPAVFFRTDIFNHAVWNLFHRIPNS